MTTQSLSLAQARRIAIAAQGLDRAHPIEPDRPVTMRGLSALVERIGLLQIDSVNVLARAHLMPAFARLGPYDPALLDRATGRSPRRLVEAWAHVASFVPPDTWRQLAFRRAWYRRRWEADHDSFWRRHAAEIDETRALLLEARRPVTAREVHARFEARHPRAGAGWWEWSVAKEVLEHLFFTGEVAIAGRTSSFERRYDLADRVIPRDVLARPVPTEADATRHLIELGARAHGIGMDTCLADYYRIALEAARPAIAELVAAGILEPVSVEGWRRPAYLHRDARIPRRVAGRAILSPFDPLVWERRRLEALFGRTYRIEIYTPAHKRVFGYYVLPFLLGDAIVAKVDLKADRAAGVLRVLTAWREDGAPAVTAEALATELRSMAVWLGLADIAVATPFRGDLAAALADELGTGSRRGAADQSGSA